MTFRSSTVSLSNCQQYVFGAILFFLIGLPIPYFVENVVGPFDKTASIVTDVFLYLFFALYFIASVYTVRIFYTKFLELIEAEAGSMSDLTQTSDFNETQQVYHPQIALSKCNDSDYLINRILNIW